MADFNLCTNIKNKSDNRSVHEAVLSNRFPCPHSSCADNEDFYLENGIGHHFRIAHRQEFSPLLLKEASDLRRKRHVQETEQYLIELFERRREHENNSYEEVTVTCLPQSHMVCKVKRVQEAVELMCLLLYYSGSLQPYSKGNKPCKVEVHKHDVHAKFDCWYMKNEHQTKVSFQTQAFFVKRDFCPTDLTPLQEIIPVPVTATNSTDEEIVDSSDEVLDILRNVLHHQNFRPKQREVVDCLMQDKDCLAIIPTGGGKTVCYCVPGLATKGVTLIISPLLALVSDQVERLRRQGINVCFVDSKMTSEERQTVFHELTQKQTPYKLFYLTPEFALSQAIGAFQSMASNGTLNRFIIDEAHCIDVWGKNFRPSYSQLSELRQFGRPICAFTGTATIRTTNVIMKQLDMKEPNIIQLSCNRANLVFKVLPKKEQHSKENVVELAMQQFSNQCGIVYCFETKDTIELAYHFKSTGVTAVYYHGQLDPFEQQQNSRAWLSGKALVMCATSAFGMGIDKPNVRFVIHLTVPKTLEEYYQEAGRAGRDGDNASCIMMYRFEDRSKLLRLMLASVESDKIIKHMKQSLDVVISYCISVNCRRQQILQYFDDNTDFSCGQNCDNCQKQPTPQKNYTEEAKNMCHCISEMVTILPKISIRQIALTYKGSKSKREVESKGFQHIPHYGTGRKVFKKDADAVLFCHHLIVKYILLENLRSTSDTCTTPYVTLGEKAAMVMNGDIEIFISL